MKVSIILPYFDAPVKGCLESIEKQTYPDIELIKISEKDLGITGRKGAGFMRNAGAKMAHGDILFFLDADAVLLPDAIQQLVAVFQATMADAVSALPLAPRETESDRLNYLLGLEYEERIRSMGEGWVSVAATTGLGVKKEAFAALGGFVTEFSRGIGEDWIFSRSLVNKGFKIWHSNRVGLYHFTAETFKKYLTKQAWHAGYRVVHFQRFKETTDSYTTFLPTTLLMCNIPLAVRLLKRRKDPAALLLFPLTLARNAVWVTAALLVWMRLIRLPRQVGVEEAKLMPISQRHPYPGGRAPR